MSNISCLVVAFVLTSASLFNKYVIVVVADTNSTEASSSEAVAVDQNRNINRPGTAKPGGNPFPSWSPNGATVTPEATPPLLTKKERSSANTTAITGNNNNANNQSNIVTVTTPTTVMSGQTGTTRSWTGPTTAGQPFSAGNSNSGTETMVRPQQLAASSNNVNGQPVRGRNGKIMNVFAMDEGSGNCRNSNQLCEFWATIGECDKNPNYMKTVCKFSCGNC